MAAMPENSLPQQHKRWSDLKAAYRFFNNPKVRPDQIQSTHREIVRDACASYDRVLVVQDGTELDYSKHYATQGLGFIGDGGGQGLLQHSALAVTTDGGVLGVLHQRWWRRQRTPDGEKRRQRQARATEACLWGKTIESIGRLDESTRLIHVMDRGSDAFETLDAARRTCVGYVLRARHNRYLHNVDQRLWAHVTSQPVRGHRDVAVPVRPRRGSRPRTPARQARVALRSAAIIIPAPRNDPRFRAAEPIKAWVVYAVEEDPPPDIDPIEWMLLTSEPAATFASANEIVEWYTHRWVIEEWHKAEKSGCRLEAAQLRDADALERLAALTAVVAVRMLQLRDLARPPDVDAPLATWCQESAGDAKGRRRLRAEVPEDWRTAVAHLANCDVADLTPARFWLTIAQQGGFIGRRSDGWPGWQTLWRGWLRISDLVYGMQVAQAINGRARYG